MKRAAMVFGVLAVAALLAAQQQQQAPAQQKQPAGATGTTPSSSAQSGSAQQGSATAAPPQGKRPPQAKTQAEFDAYNAAIANQKDPAAMEKAADDFATKFPDSELRALLFKAAMRGYQNANNGDKMLEESQKLLKIDPDDPEALIASAEVIAERTRDSDLDKDQRFAQGTKYAQHALETIDTDVPIPALPANATQSQIDAQKKQIDAYKGLLRSSAYSVLGTIQYDQEKYADAQSYFQKSIDAYPSQPDPVVVLRLALALDKQGKYGDALKEANQAVELTQEGTAAGTTARHERDRLVQLTGGIPVSGSPAPPSNPPTGSAPNTTPNPH
jgi:tetratricopeptide (TPR) repeat protein